MIPQPAKEQPNVVGEHSRESARARVAAHGGRAHTCRGCRGSSLAIGLDSCGSPSALSVPCAHSSARAARSLALGAARSCIRHSSEARGRRLTPAARRPHPRVG